MQPLRPTLLRLLANTLVAKVKREIVAFCVLIYCSLGAICALFELFSGLGFWRWRRASQLLSTEIAAVGFINSPWCNDLSLSS